MPVTTTGFAPVNKPSLYSGPTSVQPLPVKIYNWLLSVSDQRSPCSAFATSGALFPFLSPLALTQPVPSYSFKVSTPVELSYHNCPWIGFLGADVLAKFSNCFRKFSAITDP